jgi:signal transduction histidine kinase
VLLAIALNVGWILLNWRAAALLVFGIVFFVLIITGVVLNTTFLIREIRRNEQHDAFINAVTHELKTPITSIRLYLETLKTRDVTEAQRDEFYEIILADTNRLQHTVEQVLRAGHTVDKRRAINRSVIDLSELVRECVDLTRVRYKLEEDAINYSESLNEGGARVVGDSDELRAAVSNLLDNAVRYSDKEVKVSVRLDAIDEKQVAVRIRDKGIGISSSQLKRIFNRFYRAQGAFMARVKGTGLGLFIVRSIVNKHGGRVFAESEGPGQGSTFTIQLPRA